MTTYNRIGLRAAGQNQQGGGLKQFSVRAMLSGLENDCPEWRVSCVLLCPANSRGTIPTSATIVSFHALSNSLITFLTQPFDVAQTEHWWSARRVSGDTL